MVDPEMIRKMYRCCKGQAIISCRTSTARTSIGSDEKIKNAEEKKQLKLEEKLKAQQEKKALKEAEKTKKLEEKGKKEKSKK